MIEIKAVLSNNTALVELKSPNGDVFAHTFDVEDDSSMNDLTKIINLFKVVDNYVVGDSY